ncbi:hypothetical protein [Sediminivirga luteola]|uniref:Uncharacterized protein n=1 Tax=Sediminivirga luteola TaxID=1774748 RepID=A0A8J2XKH9_9MICO|nr:hypothetical protein [Sediminivirga luteola]GGA10154.1 hypothetical protein GCM10011333_11100 [Sediminivirga luteola]
MTHLPNAWDNGRDPGLAGAGMMVYAMDIAAEDVALFEQWYTHEHLPERVGIPGFRRGRRYTRQPGSSGQEHLTIYETADATVFASQPYLDRLDAPTPLTQQVVPRFVNGRRVVVEVVYSHGGIAGRELTLARFSPASEATTGAAEVWNGTVRDALRDDPGILGIHIARPDPAATQAKAATSEGRGASEAAPEDAWLLLVEGTAGTTAAAQRLTASPAVEAVTEISTYDLLMTLLPQS